MAASRVRETMSGCRYAYTSTALLSSFLQNSQIWMEQALLCILSIAVPLAYLGSSQPEVIATNSSRPR